MATIDLSLKCIVRRVNNGFTLSHEEPGHDDSILIREDVFEDNEDCGDSEIKAFLGLVYSMMEIFGIYDYLVKYEKIEK